MEKLKYRRDQVLTIVKENRENHKEIFLEAQAGYREKIIQLLEERLNEARNDGPINIYFDLPTPQNHIKEYDRVIAMLNMTLEDVVELTPQEFSQFIQDDWSWKNQFVMSNIQYSKKLQEGL